MQPYKGARDFYPEDKRVQKYIFSVWREIVERYGFTEYDAPVLEPSELYELKSGQEIVNEQTYTFTDRGGRSVTVRPEMTPTISRMVAARRQEIPIPYRVYSIPNLWRYERPQRGRLREHWQLNVDIFGVSGVDAEIEMLMIASDIMMRFGAQSDMFTIRVNNRDLVNEIMHNYLGLDAVQSHLLIKLFDRKSKITEEDFYVQAEEIFTPEKQVEQLDLLRKLTGVKQIEGLPEELRDHQSVLQLKEILTYFDNRSINNIVFDMSIMRGFDYYNGFVFEVFDTNDKNKRSIYGGGRYDGLVGMFGVDPISTIGFGIGDVGMRDFLEVHELMPMASSDIDLYLIDMTSQPHAARDIATGLRVEGVNVAVDSTGRKLDKQIRSADKQSIAYVMFVGDDEIEAEQFNVKNIITGVEERHGLERIVSIVKDYRRKLER